MDGKTAFDIISFISSIASLILAVGAIWLSVVFFKMSDAASKATTEASKDISASVERLEKLFDRLYSDTFSMMKDTVTDMRKHIWNNPKSDLSEKNEISEAVKKEIETRVKSALEAEGIGNKEKQEKVTKQLESVIESVFKSAKNRKSSLKSERVFEAIKANEPISMQKLAKLLDMEDEELVLHHLFPMRERGEITWNSDKSSISSVSIIETTIDESPSVST